MPCCGQTWCIHKEDQIRRSEGGQGDADQDTGSDNQTNRTGS